MPQTEVQVSKVPDQHCRMPASDLLISACRLNFGHADHQFQNHVYQGQAEAVKVEVSWRQRGLGHVCLRPRVVQFMLQLPKHAPCGCRCDYRTPHEAPVGFPNIVQAFKISIMFMAAALWPQPWVYVLPLST